MSELLKSTFEVMGNIVITVIFVAGVLVFAGLIALGAWVSSKGR